MVASKRFSGYQSAKVVVGTDPAANTEISQTVPAGELWLLYAVTVALVQGATQTPLPVLSITDGTTKFFESIGCTTAQAINTTCQYNWATGLVTSGLIGATTNVHAYAPLPEGLLLEAGYVIATTTVGIGAGSDYGAPAFFVLKGTA